jgi:hypothetical protein
MGIGMRRLLPIIAIMFVAWLMIILGTGIIFGIIVPLEIGLNFNYIFFDALIKLLISVSLVIVWILILYWLTRFYLKKTILRQG